MNHSLPENHISFGRSGHHLMAFFYCSLIRTHFLLPRFSFLSFLSVSFSILSSCSPWWKPLLRQENLHWLKMGRTLTRLPAYLSFQVHYSSLVLLPLLCFHMVHCISHREPSAGFPHLPNLGWRIWTFLPHCSKLKDYLLPTAWGPPCLSLAPPYSFGGFENSRIC